MLPEWARYVKIARAMLIYTGADPRFFIGGCAPPRLNFFLRLVISESRKSSLELGGGAHLSATPRDYYLQGQAQPRSSAVRNQ